MKNNDFISLFIAGNKEKAKNGHLGFKGNYLVNYSTVICVIDRENKCALVNSRKYSRTTSKIMGQVRYQLSRAGYTLVDFIGYDSYLWNWGYYTGENTEYSDVDQAIANYRTLEV